VTAGEWFLVALNLVQSAWLLLLHFSSGKAMRSVERERDEWIRKAERYYESADRGSLGEQLGPMANQANTGKPRPFTDSEMQLMAQRQRDAMNCCAHGRPFFECPVCEAGP
jgi:hypothetical protein